MIDPLSLVAIPSNWQLFSYVAIFVSLLFEGEIVIFATMFLVSSGYFSIYGMTAVIATAVAMNDLLWHKLGRRTELLPVRVRSFIDRLARPFDRLIETRSFRILLVTKFAYGLMRPTIIRTGMIGMPTKKFLRYDYPAAFLWATTIGTLGYFSSISLEILRHYFRTAEVFIAIPLVSFFILWHLIIKRLVNKKIENVDY